MNNIIWNEKELKNIKKIILKSANLRINENGYLEEYNYVDSVNYHYKARKPLYIYLTDELEDLLYIDNKEEIISILNQASQVKADITNKSHYGLIMALSKINPNNHEEIFIIFKEIISLYERTINGIAKLTINNFDNSEKAQAKLNEIINSKDITTEEKLVKQEIENILVLTNGITDYELFKPLIDKLDSLIKPKLVLIMNQLINDNIKLEIKNKKGDIDEYRYEVKRKSIRKNLRNLKAKGSKIFNY